MKDKIRPLKLDDLIWSYMVAYLFLKWNKMAFVYLLDLTNNSRQ